VDGRIYMRLLVPNNSPDCVKTLRISKGTGQQSFQTPSLVGNMGWETRNGHPYRVFVPPLIFARGFRTASRWSGRSLSAISCTV
jgi:hypothetical protein